MDTSSIGRVIDALVAIPKQAQYVTLFADTTVCDGPWAESNHPDNLVMIGFLDNGEAASAGTQMPMTFGPAGAGRFEEDYGVPCKISRWVADPGPATQKVVRDAALAQYAAFETTIRTNGTLTGLIVPPPSGQPISANIDQISFSMTDPDTTTGRMFAVDFTVHIQNSLNY
jgi:hypothetical protein